MITQSIKNIARCQAEMLKERLLYRKQQHLKESVQLKRSISIAKVT